MPWRYFAKFLTYHRLSKNYKYQILPLQEAEFSKLWKYTEVQKSQKFLLEIQKYQRSKILWEDEVHRLDCHRNRIVD